MTRMLYAGDQRLHDPGSLTLISISTAARDSSFPVSPAIYDIWSRGAKSFEAMAAEANQSFVLPVRFSSQGADEQLNVGVVTPNYFTTLGITAKYGRAFVNDPVSAANEVVISESVWRQEFAGDGNALGKTIWVNGKPYSVVGVEPDSYPAGVQLWLDRPLEISQILDTSLNISYYFNVWGRLRHGTTREQAGAELSASLPENLTGLNQPATAMVRSIGGFLVHQHATAARLVVLAAIAVFVIGCGNASMILLLRALSRQRDVAVRYVLGATRARMIWLALAEALGPMLVVILFVLGLLPLAIRVFLAFLPPEIALRGLPIDFSLVLICVVVSTLCILLPNLTTLTVLFRRNHGYLVRDGSNSLTAKDSSVKARAFLLTVQLSVTVAVSVVAVSLLKSALVITRSELGIDPKNCVVIDELLSGPRLANQEAQVRYLQRMFPRLEQAPGVTSVAAVNFLPLGDGQYSITVETAAASAGSSPRMTNADEVAVAGDYFSAIGTPLFQGRHFDWSDTAISEPVAIVDKALARKIAPEGDAVGKMIKVEGVSRKIVGIAESAQFRGLDRSFVPVIYVPLGQSHFAFPFLSIVARVDQTSPAVLRAIRDVISELPDSKIKSAEFISDVLAAALRPQTTALYTTGILASIGFLLSIIGMSAVIAYAVSQRQQEIGIRLALGAPAAAIGKTIVRGAAAPISAGILLGLILAYWSSHQVRALFYDVRPFHVEIYLGVSFLVLLAATCTILSQVQQIARRWIPGLLRAE